MPSAAAPPSTTFLDNRRIIAVSAFGAALCVAAMIGVFVATGVGQDPLQFVHPPAEYTALLLKHPAALRTAIGLDDLFIALYATLFAALGRALWHLGAPRIFVAGAVGALILLAVLDMAENFHFLVMLAHAEQGVSPSTLEIGTQVWESLLKFHVSYIGLVFLGAALPRRTRAERTLGNLSFYVSLPVGILIYVAPPPLAFALVLVRFLYFLTALVMAGALFGRGSGAPA